MKQIMKSLAFTAIAAVAMNVTNAQSTFNTATGTGFAAKGDVQRVLNLNNAGFQSTTYSFTYEAVMVTEVSWECTNQKNEKVQERERSTTTEISGVVASLARVRNQITGHNLTGWNGNKSSTVTTDGPAINSCPANPNGDTWVLTMPAGEPVTISNNGGLKVNGVVIDNAIIL